MEKENEKMAVTGREYDELKELVQENSELMAENNEILRKIHRNGLLGFWMRILWYVVIIGLPFALYFYVLEPYFNALGSNYEVFKAGINEVPGLKQLTEWIGAARGE